MSRTTPTLPATRPWLPAAEQDLRARVAGKFLFVGDEKLYVRGATYGTFRPAADGTAYPERTTVERDFALMAANSVNAIRTYTVPPRCYLTLPRRRACASWSGCPGNNTSLSWLTLRARAL